MDKVETGNMNFVTSNAVANELNNYAKKVELENYAKYNSAYEISSMTMEFKRSQGIVFIVGHIPHGDVQCYGFGVHTYNDNAMDGYKNRILWLKQPDFNISLNQNANTLTINNKANYNLTVFEL